MQDERKYLIEIPGMEGSDVWDADRWERNKDKLLNDHSDVNVFELGAYDPEDEQEGDQFLISMEGMDGGDLWDADRWNRNKERFLAENPTATVNRVRYVDYWGDKADENRAKRSELMQPDEARNAKLAELGYYDDITGGQVDFDINAPSSIGLKPLSSAVKENSVSGATEYLDPRVQEFFANDSAYTERQAEIARLDAEYEQNPAVIRYREWQAQQAEEQARYAEDLKQRIKADLEENVDPAKAAEGERAKYAHYGMQGRYLADIEDIEENAKKERYATALKFLEKAEFAREHAGKGTVSGVAIGAKGAAQQFGAGIGEFAHGKALDAVTQGDIEAYNEIGDILTGLEERLGSVKAENITPEILEEYLTKDEQALILAFYEYNRAMAEAQQDMSKWYKGGKIFAESVPFMLEFLATGGIFEAASGGASKLAAKGMTGALAKWLAKSGAKTAGKAVLKTGKALAGAAAGTLARTIASPGTYKRMAEASVEVDDQGHLHRGANAARAAADMYIENLSEISGGLIGKTLGYVGSGVGKAASWAFSKTPFAKYGTMLANNQLMQTIGAGIKSFMPKLEALGFHGLPEEIGEEFIGNAIRDLSGLQPGAFREMFEDDNFGSMLIGFAPMTLIGAAGGVANVAIVNAQAASLGKDLRDMFSHAYDKEHVDHMMSSLDTAETPEQMQQAVKPLVSSVISAMESGMITQEQGAFEIESIYQYAGLVAQNKALLFGKKDQDRQLADAKKAELEQEYGTFWQDREGKQDVQVAKLDNGSTVFVVSTPEADGKIMTVDTQTGQKGFANTADIATEEVEGESVQNSRTMSLDQFLNTRIALERQTAEQNRMLRERQEQIDALRSEIRPGTKINLGTEGSPVILFATGSNNAGVVVMDQNGAQSTLPWEQAADALGKPIIVKTDAQISDALVAEKAAELAERRKARANASLAAVAAEQAATEVTEAAVAENRHIPMKEDGTVNEAAFWEQDPEGYVAWNDEQNQDGGQDSLQQIAIAKMELTRLLDEQTAAQNTSNPEIRKAAKAEATRLAERIAQLDAIEQSYAQALEEEIQAVQETQATPTAEMSEQDLEQMDTQYQNIFGKTKVRAERVRIMQEYLDKLSEGSTPIRVLTKENYREVMAEAGCTEGAIKRVEKAIKKGRGVAGFASAGTAFVMADTIKSIEEARITYIHERQHILNSGNRQHIKDMAEALGSRENALVILENLVGSIAIEEYENDSLDQLADEIICRSMEIAYTAEDFSVALQEKGVSQEVIDVINNIDNGQNTTQSNLAARRRSGRDSYADGSGRENHSENGRNSEQVSGGLLGQEETGSLGSRGRGDGSRGSGEPGAEVSSDETPFRITAEEDAAYMEAVKAGDLATAEKMVLEAARRAMPNTKVVDENGNPKIVYHGRGSEFNVFEDQGYPYENAAGRGFYFTDDPKAAKLYTMSGFLDNTDKMQEALFGILMNEYDLESDDAWEIASEYMDRGEADFDQIEEAYNKAIKATFPNPNVLSAFINIERPLDLSAEEQERDAWQINNLITKNGYDGVIDEGFSEAYKRLFSNLAPEYQTSDKFAQYMVRTASQIKSASAVTYDDAGNVIPLSERFNMENDDLRFRTIEDLPEANLTEETKAELAEKDLVMEGGAIMSTEYADLKHETGYQTPIERNTDADDVRFSAVTMPAWKEHYMSQEEAERRVVQYLESFVERVTANELVNGVVSHGKHRYGKKESGSFAGPLRTNVEYIVTFDLDTSCPRTFQYLNFVKVIERRIGRPLTQIESIQLTEIMRMYGQQIPCVYCYSENKRQALKQYYTDYMTSRHAVISAKTEEAALAAMYGHEDGKKGESDDPKVALTPAAYKVFKNWRSNPKGTYNPTLRMLWRQYSSDRNSVLTLLDSRAASGVINVDQSDELIAKKIGTELGVSSPRALKVIEEIVAEWKWNTIESKAHDDFTPVDEDDIWVNEKALDLWRDMTSYAKSASSAKGVLRYTPYTDELKKLSQEDRDYINGMGGVRMHSSNDFRIDYVIDYFQFMADMALYKMFGHTYTKSPEFVRIFGNSGYKINMSIAAYQDENGNIRPNVDEGFDWNEAKELRRLFPNAGTMLMATSDEQLQMALDSDWIDMCIPFHRSGLPKAVWYNMRLWTDYENKQKELFYNTTEMTEQLVADGVEIPAKAKPEDIEKLYLEHFNIEVAYNKKGERIKPHFLRGPTKVDDVDIPGHNDDHQRYLDLCKKWGVKPRFQGIKVKDNTPEGNGRIVDITEHPRYMIFVKETARTDTPQTPVQFNFDQPSEALGGKTPMEYAFDELEVRAMAEAEIAGGKVSDIYNSLNQDQFGIIDQFINTVIKHKEETGEDYPLDYITPEARDWFLVQRKALEEAFQGVESIPYHRNEYDELGNLVEGVGLENARREEEERIAAEEKAAKEAAKAAKAAARKAAAEAKKAAKNTKTQGSIDLIEEAKKALEDEVMMRFIGEEGAARLDAAIEASVYMDNLNVARSMEASGKDARAIKAATGWERGADNKWRYEQEDFEFKAKPGKKKTFKLSDLIHDIMLFEAYPQLRDIKVQYAKLSKGSAGEVAVDKDGNRMIRISSELYRAQNPVIVKAIKEFTAQYPDVVMRINAGRGTEEDKKILRDNLGAVMTLNEKYVDELGGKDTLAHEIQHLIQEYEGFAQGGNASQIDTTDPKVRAEVERVRRIQEAERKLIEDYIDKAKAIFGRGKLAELGGNRAEAVRLRAEYDKLVRQIRMHERNYLALQKSLSDTYAKLGDEGYARLAGEVEARNVEKRMDMTDEQRRLSLIEDTQDVATEDQIFILDNLMMNYDEMADVSFRITPEEDAEYMKAIESGDMATAERLVAEAAERWGRNSKVRGEDGKMAVQYHGSRDYGFTVFNTWTYSQNIGSHFGTAEAADFFADKDNTYKVYLNITNPYSSSVEDFWTDDEQTYAFVVAELANKLASQGNKEAAEIYDEVVALYPMAKDEATWLEWFESGEGREYMYPHDLYTPLRRLLEMGGYDGWMYENYVEDAGSISWVALYPEQIKSAETITYDNDGNVIPLSERFQDDNEDIRFSVTGEVALYHDMTPQGRARMQDYFKAQEMNMHLRPDWNAEYDENARKIKMATGWEKGVDGLWRYEVEDIKMKPIMSWLFSREELTLGDIVEDGELLRLYPSLADIRIVKKQTLDDMNAWYNSGTKEMGLPFATVQDAYYHNGGRMFDMYASIMNDDILHEVQHAIQFIEGFADGGSSSYYGREAYNALAGEVEARNVVRRSLYTPEMRRQMLLATTEDTDRVDQGIVKPRRWRAGEIRFRMSNDNQEIFVSNAARAVEGIQMGKATPEQWLKMLEKNGGLKAGEDKWMGLSDWLKASDKKTLTKQEVLDYVNEHMIQIEEVYYAANAEGNAEDTYVEIQRILQNKFDNYMQEYYESHDVEDDYGDEARDYAMDRLHEEFNDEFPYTIERSQSDVYLTFPYEEVEDLENWAAKVGIDFKAENPINDTRLNYTTEDLDNKREIALTVPTIVSWNESDEVHFGDAGDGRAVAWIRFGETTDESGNRVLVIDEIQSKRHQEGREKGYRPKDFWPLRTKYLTTRTVKDSFYRDMEEKYGEAFSEAYTEEDFRKVMSESDFSQMLMLMEYFERASNDYIPYRNSVPDAPFDKNWHELAMKRMLRYAAENGYDVVAWTTGDQQAERYSIGGIVDDIYYSGMYPKSWDSEEKVRYVDINLRNGHIYHLGINENGFIEKEYNGEGAVLKDEYRSFKDKDLSDVVGKDVALQVMQMEEGTNLKAEDLKVGGEGMKGFYDKMLPAFMDKYGKKWGVKVEDIHLNLEGGLDMHSIPVTEEMKESVMEGQVMFRTSMDLDQEFGDAWRDQQNEDGRHSTQVANTKSTYEKIGSWMKEAGLEGASILDASSGLGLGTQALREMGFQVDDVEPFPSENREAPTFGSYDDIDGKYDVVISNAVLNVIPDDWRADVLHKMAAVVKDGGKIIINTRPASNISKQGVEGKTRITLDSPSEILVKRGDRIAAYQKGFTSEELADWIKSELGEGWRVEKATKKNSGISGEGTAVVIKEGDDVSFRTVGTPTEQIVAEGVNFSKKDLASLAGEIFAALPEESRRKITDRLNGNLLGLQDAIMQIPTDLAVKEEWSEEDKEVATAIAAVMTDAAGQPMTRPFTAREALWVLYDATNKETDLVSEASRALVKRNLGFDSASLELQEIIDDYVNFRTVGNDKIDAATDMYNYETSLWTERLKESWLDMNQSVESLQRAMAEGSGMEIEPWENVVLALNRLSSKSYADKKKYLRDFLTPMWDAVLAIAGNTRDGIARVERYLMLKHGLERNKIFAKRDAREYYRTMYDLVAERMQKQSQDQKNAALADAQKALADIDAQMAVAASSQLGRLNEARKKAVHDLEIATLVIRGDEQENEKELQMYYDAIDAEIDVKYHEFREKDYGGLTSMFMDVTDVKRSDFRSEEAYHKAVLANQKPKYKTVEEMEDHAKTEVFWFEKDHDTTDLWAKINAATKEVLRHQHEAGMITDEQYEAVRDMFEYYVPLRGFAENTAEDMYSYYMSNTGSGFAKPIIAAKGRKTKAESPLGWIGSMAESAIQADNKNDAKMKLYYAALRRPDLGILSLTETWFEYTGQKDDQGRKIFAPAYPPATDKALSADELRDHMNTWEEDMRQKQSRGEAYKGSQRVNLKGSVIFQDTTEEQEHVIRVKVAGKDYSILINGNPRAAQAINGLLNPEANKSVVEEWIGVARRALSSMLTSFSPLFWVANYQRDLLSSVMRVSESDGVKAAWQYFNNRRKAWRVASYVYKYDEGTMGDSYYEQMYKEFAENGGITGYTVLTTNKEYEKLLEDYAKSMGRPVAKAIKNVWEKFMGFGEAIEQVSRFAAYLTAREAGKSIEEAVNAAKEVSVNFNRKGSANPISIKELEKLRTKSGKPLNMIQKIAAIVLSAMPKWMKELYFFFNASVQAITSSIKLAKKSPGKAAAWAGMYFGMSIAMAVINNLLSGDDDDEEYLDLPDYLRHSTILIKVSDKYYLKWSLPQEMRPFYAWADIIVNKAMGKIPHKNAGVEMALAAMQWLPVNPFDSEDPLLSLTPDVAAPFAEIKLNQTSFGSKVYNDMPFISEEVANEIPDFRKATSKTGKVYVDLAEFLNDVTGGDEVTSGWIDFNPAKLEHIVEGYGGGIYDFAKMMVSLPGLLLGDEPVKVKDIPFVNKVILSVDETNMNSHTNEAFMHYKNVADNAKRVEGEYRASDKPERADAYRQEDDWRIYLLYKQYEDDFKEIKEKLDAAADQTEIDLLREQQNDLREMFLNDIANNVHADAEVQMRYDMKRYESELREFLEPVTDANKERLEMKKQRNWKAMNKARRQRDSLRRLPEYKLAESAKKDIRELKEKLSVLDTMTIPEQRDSFLSKLQIDYDEIVKKLGELNIE
jgi:2-polyprenyl-3-methyl-5-hydroxy-6-metoxy-1,4-benzoquinol methylase